MTRFAAGTTYAIAVLAFALSYSNLAALAGRAGYSPAMAHVWPLVVDGLAVVATAAVMRLRARRTYAWSLLGASTAVSIVAGAAAHLLPAGPLPGWAGALVAVVPPLCLLVAPHLAVQLHRDAAGVPQSVDAPVDDHGDAQDAAQTVEAADAIAPATAATRSHMTQPEIVHALPTHDRDGVTHEDAPDAVLFDLTRDAPARTRRSTVTAEQRSKVLRLAATTDMSGREIGDAARTSEASVRRILHSVGGRDALRADTCDLAALGG